MLSQKVEEDATPTLAEAQTLFDAVLEEYPTMAHRISSSANINHFPIFENAVVKQRMNGASRLDATEEHEISCFCQAGDACALEDKVCTSRKRNEKRVRDLFFT